MIRRLAARFLAGLLAGALFLPEAARAEDVPVGRGIGQRMHDLAFSDAGGVRMTLSGLKGRVVVLHFWGSWCGPCRKEMPELQQLSVRLADRRDVAFVLLQVRESFDVAEKWAQGQGIRLPLYDSGSRGEEDDRFRLAAGGIVADREIAAKFPSTYVLDRRGVVMFSRTGPVQDWPAHEGFLRDAATRSSGR